MDKPHKQLITTYPVAIKHGQRQVHIPNPIPWHAQSEAIKCPKCEIIYIVTSGFPRVQLLQALEKQHASKQEHPDHIASAPEWTTVSECDCSF
jgi:hypothetical protein